MTVRKRFLLAGLLLVGVVLLGASGFHYIEGWPWFDGFYMTIVTMTTVGYEETHPLSGAGKVFNSFLIVAAVMAGAFLLATFTQVMVEFELDKFVGRRRMQRELAKLNNHYIICGAGRVGRSVAREFRAHKVPFVFIETNDQSAQSAQDEGMTVVVGSATREEVLHGARIDHAQGLVAAVASDADKPLHRADRAGAEARPDDCCARQRGRSPAQVQARRGDARGLALPLRRAPHRAPVFAAARAGANRQRLRQRAARHGN